MRKTAKPQSGALAAAIFLEKLHIWKYSALASSKQLGARSWFHKHETAHVTAINEANYAIDLREQRVVFTTTDVLAGLQTRATLTHNDRAAADQLSAESFYSKPLRI